jgi:hypothetical protein
MSLDREETFTFFRARLGEVIAGADREYGD